MSLHRLFSPVPLQGDTTIQLGSEQARYIGKVLRLRPGDGLTVFDGSGGQYSASIAVIRKTGITLDIGTFVATDVESPLSIQLLQAVSRGERMDIVVQKATELGVSRVTPVISEYSVVKLDPERAEKRRCHWSKVAISAAEQCGRNVPPVIDAAIPLQDWLSANQTTAPAECRLAMVPGATQGLPEQLPGGTQVLLLVGPEGGLSAGEVDYAGRAGFKAVSFGPRILRTETAAIAAVAILQANYGDLTRTTRPMPREIG